MNLKKVLAIVCVILTVAFVFYGCKNNDGYDVDANSIIDFEDAYNEASSNNTGNQEDIIQENEDGSKSITYANPTEFTETHFYVDGQKIELPMSYEEFSSKTGYVYTANSLAQDAIEPEEYYLSLGVSRDADDGAMTNLSIAARNETDSTADVEKLTVVGFSAYGEDDIGIKLESGLCIGQAATVDDVIAIYGTPENSSYDADGVNGAVSYHYYTNTAYQAFTVHIENGAIYEIDMTIPF